MYYDKFSTQLFTITLIGDKNGIKQLIINDINAKFAIKDEWQHSTTFFSDAKQQLREYFSGNRTEFNLTLNPFGTVFQKHAWQQLRHIPYGSIKKDKDIAISLGNSNNANIVNSVNNKNPIPILIPSHRVINSDNENQDSHYRNQLNKLLREFEQKNQTTNTPYKTHKKNAQKKKQMSPVS